MVTYLCSEVDETFHYDLFQSPYGDFGNVTNVLLALLVLLAKLFQSPYGDFGNVTPASQYPLWERAYRRFFQTSGFFLLFQGPG